MTTKFKTLARENGKVLDLFYPERGQVYTLREIETRLYLRDSAHLNFTYEGVEVCVQGEPDIDFTQPSAIADSEWRYVRETEEWIPVFRYAGTTPIDELLHVEPSLNYCSGKRDGGYHAYFHGHVVAQQLSAGVVPAPDAKEPLPEIEVDFQNEEQRKRVEFVRLWCPLETIAEAERKYAIYKVYRDEGQTQLVSRQYAGML